MPPSFQLVTEIIFMKAFAYGVISLSCCANLSWLQMNLDEERPSPECKGGQGSCRTGSLDEEGLVEVEGLGEIVLVSCQQEEPSSSRIAFQPSCLGRT
jgi:hypothetical protein